MNSKLVDLDYSCRCGCGLNGIDSITVELLQDVLEYFEEVYMHGLTPFVNSGCRCVLHNEKVQKEVNPNYKPYSSKSRHLPDFNGICHAIDFGIKQVPPYQIYKYLDEMYPGCLGLGKYKTFVHIDSRPKRARW